MTPFDLLSRPVREFIFKKGWTKLTDIQVAAITRITQTSHNYILEAYTASGKTEAAFFPAISMSDFTQDGVQILYISPLKALINDQMNRVVEMCSSLDIPITKWHGDANQSEKLRLLAAPGGIMLITPESIEAMFQEHPERVSQLFPTLKFVIIDEIHSYLGNDRGVQLRSLLSRMRVSCGAPFRMIALSATLGGCYDEVRSFMGDAENTKILRDSTLRHIDTSVRYFKSVDSTPSPELIQDLYESTKDRQALVFSNSRYSAEYLTRALMMQSAACSGHGRYFTHHSSVDNELRENAENDARRSSSPFVISCTSTLELGIDIGELDLVAQVGAPRGSATLIQRAGRSGRRNGSESKLIMYLTNPSEVVLGTSCSSLLYKHVIDTPEKTERPYNCLVHQILSTIKEKEEVDPVALYHGFKSNWAFRECDFRWFPKILSHLRELNVIELVGRTLIIGTKGERIIRESSFYTMFTQTEEFSVFCEGIRIGSISPDGISEGDCFILAAAEWRIVDIDNRRKRVTVIRASASEAARYHDGSTLIISQNVMEEALDMVMSEQVSPTLDAATASMLEGIRRQFTSFKTMKDGRTPYTTNAKGLVWYPFVGTKVLNAIAAMLGDGVKCRSDRSNGLTYLTYHGTYEELLVYIKKKTLNLDENYQISILRGIYQNKNDIFWESVSKYSSLLPLELRLDMILQLWYDFPAAIDYLDSL